MKKAFKINLAAVLALFMAFGLMSFKAMSLAPKQSTWFSVEAPDGMGRQLIGTKIDPPSGDCDELITINICAVELEEDHSYQYLDEVLGSPNTAGSLTP